MCYQRDIEILSKQVEFSHLNDFKEGFKPFIPKYAQKIWEFHPIYLYVFSATAKPRVKKYKVVGCASDLIMGNEKALDLTYYCRHDTHRLGSIVFLVFYPTTINSYNVANE
jgi:hypothetical protein